MLRDEVGITVEVGDPKDQKAVKLYYNKEPKKEEIKNRAKKSELNACLGD